MANAFGRGSQWHGGTGPPPTQPDKRNDQQKHNKTHGESTKMIQQKKNVKMNVNQPNDIRTLTVQQTSIKFSQSLKSFVSIYPKSTTSIKMSPPTANQSVVTPDKPVTQAKLTSLGKTTISNRFFTKRKKTDDECTHWTKAKLVEEVTKLWNASDTKKEMNCNDLTEQELRKELYDIVTSSKKQRHKDDAIMDIGNLLVDSTMEYSPTLSEASTDEEITHLEKHDAILELAHFIQKCGKRANMYHLHDKSIKELHEQLKLARDEHQKVHEVFPELTGNDAKWFGPKSERRDPDYEPSVTSDQDPTDWWDDAISAEELQTIETEKDSTVKDNGSIIKTDNEKAYLKLKHDNLYEQLVSEAQKDTLPQITKPNNDHEWTKEKLASTIIPLGKKIGKTVYYTVLMTQTKKRLRAQLATFQSMYKEQKEQNQKNQKNQLKNNNKKETKNSNQKTEKKESNAEEPGSDGEFEWTDNIVTQPDDTPLDDNSVTEVTPVKASEKANQDSKTSHNQEGSQMKPQNSKENESVTIVKYNTPDEIIEVLDRLTLISIIHKRKTDDIKPLNYMLNASMEELQNQVKYFRPLLGKDVIKVSAIDEEFHRQRDSEYGPDSEWGKNQAKHERENQIPANFDQALVCPNEAGRTDTSPEKHHKSFASVDKEDRLNGNIMTANPSDTKGVDISLFTPQVSDDPNSINAPPSGDPSKPKTDVVLLIKKTFNIRVAFGLKHRGHHTPTDVKSFVKLLLSIDSNIRILPFLSQNENTQDHDVITNEEDLPDSQDDLKKWAVDLEVSHNNKLHFGMRMTSTLTFAELRRHLFSWCTKTKSFIKFDNIKSTKIFGVGWILGAHPSFHNRNTLKSVLFKNAPDLINKVSIYPRRVWADSTATTKRVITNAIVIDGCFFERHKIIQHVCSYKWTGSYHDATFIPFKLSENFTAEHRQKAMQEQNIYLRDMWSKTVKVQNSTDMI